MTGQKGSPRSHHDLLAIDVDVKSRGWWKAVPPTDREIYQAAGYGSFNQSFRRPALLVIDATIAFTGTSPLPILDAIQKVASTCCGEAAWDAIPNIATLLAAFRLNRSPVVYTRPEVAWPSSIRGATLRPLDSRVGTLNGFLEVIAPDDAEWICDKTQASAFFGTPLETYFRRHEIQTIVVCGGTTSGCVRASAVDGYAAGFNVVVAEDATFDRASTAHMASLFDIYAKYGIVAPTSAISFGPL